MKPIVTAAQSREQDASYEGDLGAIMERAGYAVAKAAARMGAGYGRRVVVLAGRGNNGGDGYVAARYLARRGAHVTVKATGPAESGQATAAEAAWRRAGGVVEELGAPTRADLIIDAVFGVGFRGELPKPVAGWGAHSAPILAVDVPSGLDATTGEAASGTLRATETVTLSHYKTGQFFAAGPEVCGHVEVADLGLPPAEATLLLCEGEDAPRPARERDAHKWSAGSVAVVGGSAGMAGAAILAATAALRFGAGAVATFIPGTLAAEVDAAHPEIMTNGIGTSASLAAADAAVVAAAVKRFDVVVLGPGLGDGVATFVADLLKLLAQPVVLDADGLNVVSPDLLATRLGPTIITPHAGEFHRLTDNAATYAAAAELAGAAGVTVVLKGPATVVADPGNIPWLVTAGGPELATVGTGDVLAGMIAALRARDLDDPTAARSAVFWHGEAASSLAATSTVTAEKLADVVRRFAF